MKNILILLAFNCALGAAFTAQSQTQPFQPLEFKNHKIWQNGERLKNKEAGIIFRKQGGKEALLEWKKYKTSQAIGWLAFIGGGILCIATLPTIGTENGRIVDNGNKGLSLTGGVISLSGIVVLIAGNSHRKKAVSWYNKAIRN